MRQDFASALRNNQQPFGINLEDKTVERLADYYDLVQQHNPILHLVAPCTAGEFATRHILESLTLLEFLPEGARFADVGTGAGLPSIPCLLAREDLHGTLIESKEKKIGFLKAVVERLGLSERAMLVNRQFSEVPRLDVDFITCRALDKFADKLPQLLKWAGAKPLLLFGGPSLEEALEKANRKPQRHLMPLSERRYLFHVSARITS